MAQQDEILNLVLKVQGQAEAERLRESAAGLTDQIVKLGGSLAANDPVMLRHAATLQSLNARADALEKQFGKATSKMAGFGQSALQGGRFLQDFAQGGIGGVLNNIEGLAMALGGGAGLAGVLTAVGIAAMYAKPALEKLWASMFGAAERLPEFKTALQKMREEVERFAKEPIRTVVDFEVRQAAERRLKSDEKDVAAGAAVAAQPDARAAARGKAFSEAIGTGAGGGDVFAALKGMIQHQNEQIINNDPMRKQAIADIDGKVADTETWRNRSAASAEKADLLRRRKGITDRQAEQMAMAGPNAAKEAEKLLGQATSGGPGQDEAQARIRRMLKESGPLDEADEKRRQIDIAGDTGRTEQQLKDEGQRHAQQVDEWQRQELENAKKQTAAMEKLLEDGRAHERILNEMKAHEESGNVRGNFAAADRRREVTDERARLGVRASQSITDRLGGVAQQMTGDDLTNRMAMARERGLMQLQRSPGAMRRFQRMTLGQQLQTVGGINDRIDQQAVEFQTNRIMKSGLTNNRRRAAQIAQQQVAASRQQLNGMTGDPETQAQIRNTESLDKLTEAMTNAVRNGVPIILEQ